MLAYITLGALMVYIYLSFLLPQIYKQGLASIKHRKKMPQAAINGNLVATK